MLIPLCFGTEDRHRWTSRTGPGPYWPLVTYFGRRTAPFLLLPRVAGPGVFLGFLLVLLGVVSQTIPAAEWPQFRGGPQRSGVVAESKILADLSAGAALVEAWRSEELPHGYGHQNACVVGLIFPPISGDFTEFPMFSRFLPKKCRHVNCHYDILFIYISSYY